MKFDELANFYLNEASDSLRQWFKRGGTDPKTGGSYPACRPTKAECNKIKGKMYKKKSSKRVSWKK